MMDNDSMIGARIRRYRHSQRLLQEAVAERADMSVSYLSRIETGSSRASMGMLTRIADALNVSLASLLIGDVICEDVDEWKALRAVLEGCGEVERRIIMDVAVGSAMAAKRSLCEHRNDRSARRPRG